jgi:hypothetical protein
VSVGGGVSVSGSVEGEDEERGRERRLVSMACAGRPRLSTIDARSETKPFFTRSVDCFSPLRTPGTTTDVSTSIHFTLPSLTGTE